MLRVIKPGLQATLQGAPRTGHRHLGIPFAGPADPLSMALANRLVGNAPDKTAIEITLGGFEVETLYACSVAIAGAIGEIRLSGCKARAQETIHLEAGERLVIRPPSFGARTYLAVAGGLQADTLFGSTSTYLPAGFGGLSGRALQASDMIEGPGNARYAETLATPIELRPVFTHSFALRTCASAETELLTPRAKDILFSSTFTAGRQGTRMGLSLEGHQLELSSDGLMKSVATYPGTVQCPPSGIPIALLCDAQTTGGYPRIAHIARCDRHLLGQIRPGDQVRLLHRTPAAAVKDHASKSKFLNSWLNDLKLQM